MSPIRTALLLTLLLLASACSTGSARAVPGEWDFVLTARGRAFVVHQGTVQLEGKAEELNGQLFPTGNDKYPVALSVSGTSARAMVGPIEMIGTVHQVYLPGDGNANVCSRTIVLVGGPHSLSLGQRVPECES